MIEEKVKELGLEIPEAPMPLASYIPSTVDGDLVYTAGQLPMVDGKLNFIGQVSKEVSEDDAINCAKISALNCLSVIKKAIGDLDKIERIVKVVVFVNSPVGYNNQPKIANGASDFIAEVFGEAGKHVRSAVGVSALPLGAPVEIEMIARIKK